MTPNQFERSCQILYGDNWRNPVASDFDISLRTVQRYDAGDSEVPKWLRMELLNLLNAHVDMALDLIEELEE